MMDISESIHKEVDFLRDLNLKEYMLYTKWQLLKDRYDDKCLGLSAFFGTDYFGPLKNRIWAPKEPMDFLTLKPVLLKVDTKSQSDEFIELMDVITSFAAPPYIRGKQLKYIVKDEVSKKYLGVIRLCSDFFLLGPRDDHIGWTKENKVNGKLNSILAMNACLPVQPFGYNYTGGKLLALLALSDVVMSDWNEKYSDSPLAGLVTTGLYGGFSQYSGLKPYWKGIGITNSEIPKLPSMRVYKQIREWIKTDFPETYEKLQTVTYAKTRFVSFAYKKLGISLMQPVSRGVFFSQLYDNTLEFLNEQTNQLNHMKFDNSIETLTNLWKEKHATKRIKNVLNKSNFSTDASLYDDLIYAKTWPDVKRYINRLPSPSSLI